jgi:uncharacterized protein YecA (UPF0149 family)
MDVIEQLQKLKAEEKFPKEEWDERGLIPSSPDVREKMNQEVNSFIDFIEVLVKEKSGSMENKIQSYLDDWDSYDYDTEETEYIVDVMCQIMQMVDMDCNKLLI